MPYVGNTSLLFGAAAGGGSASLLETFYITDPSGSVDGELRKISSGGTDAQVIASLATAVDSIRSASDGPFVLHGYVPDLDKLVFSDEDGFAWTCDRDGTNIAQIPDQSAWSGDVRKGYSHGGGIYYVAGTTYLWRYIDPQTGEFVELGSGGAGFINAVKVEYDPTGESVFALMTDGDIWQLSLSTASASEWEGGGTDPMFCVLHDASNSDASVGGIWMIDDKTPSAGNEDLVYYSIDNHSNGVADELHTLDLVGTGTPIGGVSEVVDMVYDAENGVVYLLIDEDGAGTVKVYSFTHSESVGPSDISLVGAVSADAIDPATFLTLYLDEYDDTSLTIEDTGPIAWFDAADAEDAGGATPTNGEVVAAWPDKSGNGNDVQTIFGSPVYNTSVANLNSKPAITLDGNDDAFRIPDDILKWPLTAFAVFEQAASPGDSGYILWSGDRTDTLNTWGLFLNTDLSLDHWRQSGGGGSGDFSDTGKDITANVGNILATMSFDFDGGAFGALHRIIAPSEHFKWTDGSFAQPDTAAMSSPQIIGCRPDSTLPSTARHWECELAEIILYDRRLTFAEWRAVWDELATKYNL